ncbi:MAG: hypothetical protein K2N94_04605 [Lachnospiraceae bacterium]|nr:hypothetical protein [Lachnospiraceae bacterium]
MKNMKKRFLAVLLVTVSLLSLAGCGKFKCDMCGEEKSGKKHEQTVLGETLTICDDCYETVKGVVDLFK